MSKYTPPPRTKTRKTLRRSVVGLIVVTAAIVGTLAYRPASSSVPVFREVLYGDQGGTTPQDGGSEDRRGDPRQNGDAPGDSMSGHAGAVTVDDGVLPDGVTVFDDKYPGVANLDPALLQAMREAAMDAAGDGIEFYVTSGWRSPEYQNQLLREAVFEYGSEAEASRWVATADTSAHVSGDAVDIGSYDAAEWLSVHGVEYGLCQVYGNEPWHFELSPQAIGRGCPPMYADPTQDPRMQQ